MNNIFLNKNINIDDETQVFLEANIDLIEDEDWESLWHRAMRQYDDDEEYDDMWGRITYVLLRSGIDILKTNKYVYEAHLYNVSSLIQVEFPEDVILGDLFILSDCENLLTIILPKNFHCENDHFHYSELADNCQKLNKVIYKGTIEEYKQLDPYNKLFGNSNCPNLHKITCVDGDILI